MNTENAPSGTLIVANITAFVGVLVINVLSNSLPLNGRTAAEISAELPSYFTPAGYTFSIWGLIYLTLGAFIVYQAWPQSSARALVARLGWLFVLSSIFNAAWLFAWHYGQYLLSVPLMIALLATLAASYVRLGNGRPDGWSWRQRYLIQLPVSLYLGWITVATIANIASVAAWLGWDGFGLTGPTWAAIMMGAAVVVATILLRNRRDIAYAGVLIWALFGIRAAYPETTLIATSALVASGLIAVAAITGVLRAQALQPRAQAINSLPA